MLIFLTLLMFYSLFRLLFCFIKVFQKKEIKKFLWGDLVFGIVYLFLCIEVLGKDFFFTKPRLTRNSMYFGCSIVYDNEKKE